jgi:hypothetical protein
MSVTQLPECLVATLDGLADDAVDEFVGSLRDANVDVRIERTKAEDHIFAGVEWLLPTAIVLFVAEKYFGTLIAEEAKAHYPIIREALKRLIRRVLPKDQPPLLVEVVSAHAPLKKSEDGIGILSVYSRLPDGRTVKFVFEASHEPEAAAEALHPFLSRFVATDAWASLPQTRQIVFRYNIEKGLWVVAYPHGS